jgi:antirestriction protein ArdC
MKIAEEFKRLKRKFDLNTKLYVNKSLFKDRPRLLGFYLPGRDLIVLPDLVYSKMKMHTLLHELGHAVQHKEERHIKTTKVQYYADEIEAELFAFHYSKTLYGIQKGIWNLGTFADYCFQGGFLKKKKRKKGPFDGAAAFITRYKHKFKPKTKKNIQKYIKSLNS